MKIARIIIGIIYLLGAGFNIFIVITEGWQSYTGFAEATFIPGYRDAWVAVAVPNIILIVILLIVFEICLGLTFIALKKYLKYALILGILFCLASMPTMIEAIYTNLTLALVQAFMLWKELHSPARIRL